MPSVSKEENNIHGDLQALIESARPFLRGELEKVDPRLPSLVAVLRSVGAGECWHKHGSFLDHLVDTHRILTLWRSQPSVSLCGLFHSAYSNSYVNLAIFDPSTARSAVADHLGAAAENLVHLFCVVPRQSLIHDDLLFRYSDADLIADLEFSAAEENRSPSEAWRIKLNEILPASGVAVKHIKTGEEVRVSRRHVAVFLMMTMADFSDQIFGFQDVLFENGDGRLEFKGSNVAGALWPGTGKPGLWMNSVSRMGALYRLIAREEEILDLERKQQRSQEEEEETESERLELVIPPVFENCTRVLSAEDQIIARDLYWEAVCCETEMGLKSEELLLKSIEKNPFVGEPRVVLGQVYLGQGRFEEAEREAAKGLKLILEWGSPWDKRMSWEGWVAWARVLRMKAGEKSWPDNPWGILNLGLVK